MSVLHKFPNPQKWRWHESDSEYECPCGIRHPLRAHENHECCGCCSTSHAPNRDPLPGDFAVSRRGVVGVVCSPTKEPVNVERMLKDPIVVQGWLGLTVTNHPQPIMSMWGCETPCVLQLDLWEILKYKKSGSLLRVPYLTFAPYVPDGWARQFQYMGKSDHLVIRKWIEEDADNLLARRKRVQLERSQLV